MWCLQPEPVAVVRISVATGSRLNVWHSNHFRRLVSMELSATQLSSGSTLKQPQATDPNDPDLQEKKAELVSWFSRGPNKCSGAP